MNTRISAACLAVVGLGLSASGLGGCVILPEDRGAAAARQLIEARSPVAGAVTFQPDAARHLSHLLEAPLGADDAVRIALANNPRVRGLYAEMGIAAGDVYDATRLANPSLSFLRLSTDVAGDGAQTTWGIAQNFTDLLFIAYRSRLGRSELRQAEQRLGHAVLELEADVREAYYRYAGAASSLQMRQAASRATSLSADLAGRFHEAGNISLLELSRAQAEAGESVIGEQRVAVTANAARGQLLTLLGLRSDDPRPRFLPTLALPGDVTFDVAALEQLALQRRLDLDALRAQEEVREAQLVHAGRWRWLGGLVANAEREREPDGEVRRGGGGAIELPLFNSGKGTLLRARGRLESTAAARQEAELELANDLATQLAALKAAAAIVEEYRLRLLPLRERIVSLSQREQNFMFIGAFELLAVRREELDTYERYIDAIRDFWIERVRLARLTGGSLPDATTESLVLPSIGGESPRDEHSGHEPANQGGAQ